jgi:hypothetical protein
MIPECFPDLIQACDHDGVSENDTNIFSSAFNVDRGKLSPTHPSRRLKTKCANHT